MTNKTCKNCKHCIVKNFENRSYMSENMGHYCQTAKMRINPKKEYSCFEIKNKT